MMISIHNILRYRIRHGEHYQKMLPVYRQNKNLNLHELEDIQFSKLIAFLKFAQNNSAHYKKIYKDFDFNRFTDISDLTKLPIINKELLQSDFEQFITISPKNAVIGKTGGTTGLSLIVYYTKEDIQERHALLDNFRSGFGYHLGKKTAWFSGKTLLTDRDIIKNIFWKTDFWYKTRYYSTFHIQNKNLQYYIEDLISFRPEYLVGFPSSMQDIAKFGLNKNIAFPDGMVEAIFPTAEKVTDEIRTDLGRFFKAKVLDQYASSEGAPFIFECIAGKLHVEMQSGVFEVLDNNDMPAESGRLIVTSFSTHGTPLIRYDIGDMIELSDEVCNCGNNNPIVKEINGRINDYIYSPEVGKINLGNVSNTLKGVSGVIKFQIVQNALNALQILLVKDENLFTARDEQIFLTNIRERVGNKMEVFLQYVSDIPNERNGKFRLVKNDIYSLVEKA
jgi:phenylacetate-CoA ligase